LTPPRWLATPLLAVATLLAFSGVLRNDWILLDDPLYVYENPHVNRGLTADAVRWCLRGPHGGNWHPLTSLSHVIDVELFGLAPRGHHAVSLALHAANAVLVLLVLAGWSGAWWRSAVVAGLFALHPLRVESVAWVSERKDVLCAFFFLLALGAGRLARERPTAGRRAAVVVFAALALLSKPMAVTLPFVIILLDVFPLGDRGAAGRTEAASWAAIRKRAATHWPLFALAAASAFATLAAQRASGGIVSFAHVPFGDRLANAAVSYWTYIAQTIRPVDLAVFYPFGRPPPLALALLAGAAIAAVTWVALAQRRRRPHLALGWLWYVGMFVPVVGIVQVGGQSHADRYTYLPSVGLLVAAVWGAADLAPRRRRARIALAAAAVAAIAALSMATARQVARWRDTRTLFTHALAVTDDNWVAHLYLGDVELREGRVDDAVPHFIESLRLAPHLPETYNKLGAALGAQGHNEDAVDLFRQALTLDDTAELRHNLGFALDRLSRRDEAIREYETALRLDPDHALSLLHLGEALRSAGRLDESARLLRRAVDVAPGSTDARRALAVTLILTGAVEEAIAEYEAILGADAADLDALVNIAWIRATHADAAHRDGAAAVAMAERARAASPEPVAVVEATLAAAYAEAGRAAEAVAAGERAVALAAQSGDSAAAARYAAQLERYRRGNPFHFAP
jgi:tetratricopeptide (TPR) repeat protein